MTSVVHRKVWKSTTEGLLSVDDLLVGPRRLRNNMKGTNYPWFLTAKTIWVKVFKNGPSKTHGRQSLENVKW